MVGVVCSSQIMPTIFQKPQSIDWGFFIAVISTVYMVFSIIEILTTFVILGTEKSLKNLVCPFCAQIVPWLIFEQVGFDPHSNLKEMKLNYFFSGFIAYFK